MNDILNRFTSLVRKGVDEYNMIETGDRIAVGVSAGKDSLTLLEALAALKRSEDQLAGIKKQTDQAIALLEAVLK